MTTTKEKKETKKEKKEATINKTSIVLEMVGNHKNRKEILDKLCSINGEVSRKSNAGLVSHIFVKHDLIGKVPSGVNREAKKEIKQKKDKKVKTKK